MESSDLKTMYAAHMAFRAQVMGLVSDVEWFARRLGHTRDVEAPDFKVPPFMWASQGPERAHFRCLDVGRPALARILEGWTPPDLEVILAAWGVTPQEVWQAQERFAQAAADVAIEIAVHAPSYQGELDDRSQWRRTLPGAFPDQARAQVPAAQAALTELAAQWLALVGSAPAATFLPKVA